MEEILFLHGASESTVFQVFKTLREEGPPTAADIKLIKEKYFTDVEVLMGDTLKVADKILLYLST